MFLPPSVTSLVQPMDQGVIECLKRRYRKKMVSSILQHENLNLMESLKTINIKDVVYMAAQAWTEIPSLTFLKSWRKLWPDIECKEEGEMQNKAEDENLLQDVKQLLGNEDIDEADLEEWIKCDSLLENEIMNDTEIAQFVQKEDKNDSDQGSDEDDMTVPKMTHSEGKDALESALRYIEQQSCSTTADIMCIQKWREYAAKK